MSLREGAIKPFNSEAYKKHKSDLLKCSEIEGVPVDVPYQKLSAKQKKWVLEGSHGKSEFAKSNWRGVYSFFQKWKRNLIKCTSVFFSRDTDHMMTVRSAKGKD